jgi:hypothetical protein
MRLAGISQSFDGQFNLSEGARFKLFALDNILDDERTSRSTVNSIDCILIHNLAINSDNDFLAYVDVGDRSNLRWVNNQNSAANLNLMFWSKFNFKFGFYSRPRVLRRNFSICPSNGKRNPRSDSDLCVFDIDFSIFLVNNINAE